jgi:hypothetical protein
MAGVAMKAGLYGIDALVRAGDGAGACELAREAQALLADTRPVDMLWAEALWLLARGFQAGGDEASALAVLGEAARWIRQEALPRVPEPFRDAFLRRQPVNRDVLAAAARRGW